ncbi:ABC transporter substrate-binding protein [Paenibacillus sp. GCM10027628]|uniref:ABC transporter substrate-binding protein n=1 Tax=Paenibacillus sp. GCM10027628 TaxID=3273413 RepID=UPI00362D734E
MSRSCRGTGCHYRAAGCEWRCGYRSADVETATIYNEYYVVLGCGVKETDMNVFNFDDAGVAMLEDTLIAKKDWVDKNHELVVKVVDGAK